MTVQEESSEEDTASKVADDEGEQSKASTELSTLASTDDESSQFTASEVSEKAEEDTSSLTVPSSMSIRSSRMSVRSSATASRILRSGKTSIKSVASQITTTVVHDFLKELRRSTTQLLVTLDDLKLIATVKELEKSVSRLRTENGVFYRYLLRHEPESVEQLQPPVTKKFSVSTTSSTSVAKPAVTTASKDMESADSLNLSPQVLMTIALTLRDKEPPKVNVSQKSDLVMRDMEEIQANLKTFSKKAKKVKFVLVSEIEEMETRKEEIESNSTDFRLLKENNEQISLEKWARFMDECLKKSRLTADKVRLRYTSYRVQYQKLSSILAHKLLIGENLQEIDFEQLRIENVHLTEKIEKKTILLLELKKMTGAGNLLLSQHKHTLQDKVQEKQNLVKAIAKKERSITQADDELMKIYPEVEDVKNEFERVKYKVSKYKAPEIIEYVSAKGEVENLRKEMKIWRRRYLIKEMALRIEVTAMKKLLRSNKVYSCWFE